MTRADLVVVGAGIVGLATARAALLERPGLSVLVIDKEGSIAGHQTGRNSGVIHAGVYYKPGSAKARMCAHGRETMVRYCSERGIAHEVCGKLVVAVADDERGRLAELQRRCEDNGVAVERIGPAQMREIEPHVVGVEALHVKATGIVDYAAVCRSFADDIAQAGGELRLGAAVSGVSPVSGSSSLRLHTTGGDVVADRVVNCAGLQADRVARLLGGPEAAQGMIIVPFRGEYYELAPSRSHLVNGLIYPTPNPLFPFLGVHLTRGINGHIHAGPNAVLALAREGYSWRTVQPADVLEILRSSGFRSLAREHWRYGAHEVARSFSRTLFARALARLVPDVTAGDLEPAPAGVRAQAIHPDGRLADDFELHLSNGGRVLNVLNAPSPAATASLAIGEHIARTLLAG